MHRRDFLKTVGCMGAVAILPQTTPAEPTILNSPPIQSGLPDLDRLTGGFQPGDLVMLLARTGHGKTAFCRTILDNNPQIKPEIYTPKEGNYDLLFMKNNTAYFQPECDLDFYWNDCPEPWQRMQAASRLLKNHAVQMNEVVIWTIPILHRPDAKTLVVRRVNESYSPMRCADFVLTIKENDCPYFRNVHVIKSRRGKRGSVEVTFGPGKDGYAVMKEPIRLRLPGRKT